MNKAQWLFVLAILVLLIGWALLRRANMTSNGVSSPQTTNSSSNFDGDFRQPVAN